jgi:hypothetical protein
MELESSKSPESLAVLVVGTDTLIEALPARPIQLANACGALGFDIAIPASWGDELVAEAALRTLGNRGPAPAILCSCPMVRQRLLQAGNDLLSSMVLLESSPVAVARHLRATMGRRAGSISFVGRCPSAKPPDYDVAYDPQEFFALLRTRGVDVHKQPDVFLNRIPPDRRRFVSLPGGCPTPEALWQRCSERELVEVEGPDFSIEVAQHLMSANPILVDAAVSAGCPCSGVTHSTTGFSARVAVMSLEPPRSSGPIVSDEVLSGLTIEVPEELKLFDDTSYVGEFASLERPPLAITPLGALKVRKK